MYAKLVIFSHVCKQKLIFVDISHYELCCFIANFCGSLELTFVAIHLYFLLYFVCSF